MKLATASGVLGEKIMMDSIFNSLVNDQGNKSFNFTENHSCNKLERKQIVCNNLYLG